MRPGPPPPPAPAPLNAHALLIQICGYPHRPLPEVSDAADLAEVLQDPQLCGYPSAQVRVLIDHQATRAAVLTELRSLVAAADADASVVVYFSGHGGQLDDAAYLIPIDAELADLPGTAISAQDFARELAPLRARKVLLLFDCCHAGGLEAKELRLRPGLSEAAYDALARGRGWALLAASGVDESSYVVAGHRNGIFTKHLLAGLRGGRPSDDGLVRVFDLFEYLQPLVSREAPAQHPLFKCALHENFAVARYRGGAIDPVPRIDEAFTYHALLCYAQADAPFVRTTLLPRLRAAGLRVATTRDVEEPGLDRVLGLERGLEQARRTLVVVSRAFLRRDTRDDKYTDHAVLQQKHADIRGGRFSLIPIYLEAPDSLPDCPSWLQNLSGVDVATASAEHHLEGALQRLLQVLKRPVRQR